MKNFYYNIFMGHVPFFYSEDLKELNEIDSHHFVKVLRGKVGDKFLVCDGNGKIYYAIAKEYKNKKLIFEIEKLKEIKERKKISIASSIPKGQRMAYLIEKACEIGVDRIYPLIAKYSSVRLVTPGMAKRFNSIARAACMQSEKGFLTKVEDPLSLKDAILKFEKIGVLEMKGEVINWKKFKEEGEILFIGPEGGWAEEEIKIFKEKKILLLPLIDEPLRIETAAITGLSFYYAFNLNFDLINNKD